MGTEEPTDYVRIKRVLDAFKEKNIRVSAEAKVKLIEIINKKIQEIIDSIINKLPKYTRGANKGELKRKTIKLIDLEDI